MGVISIRGVPPVVPPDGLEVTAADLVGVPLLAPLAGWVRAAVAAGLDLEQVGPGHQLVRRGRPGYALVLLRSGTAGLWSGDRVVRRLGPGDWHADTDLTLMAESSVTAYVMDGSSLRHLARRTPEAVELLRERMACSPHRPGDLLRWGSSAVHLGVASRSQPGESVRAVGGRRTEVAPRQTQENA